MHDPMTMAFRVLLPRLKPYKHSWNRRSKWLWTLMTVWHRDPSGFDDITCKYKDHIKHPQHWRLQFDLWQTFRRRHLDKCAWCNGKSAKRDSVNIGFQWDVPERKWWGHRDCFHQECASVHEAHLACLCANGIYESELSGWGYGACARCGKRREWRSTDRRQAPTDQARSILATIPKGQRDAAKYARVKELWATYRK